MREIKNMPFSGVKCDLKEKTCKVQWLSSIENETITVEVKNIPLPEIAVGQELKVENELKDLFKNSIIDIEGLILEG